LIFVLLLGLVFNTLRDFEIYYTRSPTAGICCFFWVSSRKFDAGRHAQKIRGEQ
jgi:hypothetical protein